MEYRLIRRAHAPAKVPVLDPAQRAVVAHQAGPLLVLAGPGTGKTTTLVEAVVDRVRRGVPVENILVLTFAQRAAAELRERVAARLDATIREPVARTFHSYAFGLLRSAADAQMPVPRLLSGTEQDIMLRELLDGDVDAGTTAWPAHLQPALRTRGFAAELRNLLLRAIERDLDSAELIRWGREHSRPDWEAAGAFLQQYLSVTALQRPGAYDAAELIGAAIDTLADSPELLAREHSRRRHVFVDEYQDTDPAQTLLLRMLASGADELVLVGDPDQSIYGFRGADADAMSAAAARLGLPALPTVELAVSRRSGANLLTASRRIAAALPGSGAHRFLAAALDVPAGRVDVELLRSRNEEAAAIAAALRRAHLDDGVPWSQMAVIVRSTVRSAAVLRRAMVIAGVPVHVAAQDLPLAEQNAVSQLLSAMQAVTDVGSLTDEAAESLLVGSIGDADSLYLRRLRRHLGALAVAAGDASDTDVLGAAVGDAGLAAVLPSPLRGPLVRVQRVLAAGRAALDAGSSAEDILWAVWEASGLAAVWERQSFAGGPVGAAADRNLDAVIELFAAAARLADRLPGASPQLLYEHIAAQQIPGDPWRSGSREGDGVSVLTAHASKGLEWDFVCVAGVQEGVWPDLRLRGSLLGAEKLVDIAAGRGEVSGMSTAPLLADERRLFYVAVTRARRRLLVTAAQGEDERPSRFLDELDPVDGDRSVLQVQRPLHLTGVVAQLRCVVTDPDRDEPDRAVAAELLAELAAAGVPGADPNQWWGLAELSDERGIVDDDGVVSVSPSTVDAYLTCAMKTFLEAAGGNTEPGAKAGLGTIVHEIAELAADDDDIARLEELMDERWPALDFGAAWYGRQQRKRASVMLQRLSDWLKNGRAGLELVGREQPFEVAVDGDGRTVLRGSVDRVERDEQGRAVVVDFKTSSSPGSAKALDQHPQLSAYQLAAQLGAFADADSNSDRAAADGRRLVHPGGAWLVQLGSKGALVQKQPPLDATSDPGWIRAAVDEVAALQRGARFDAKANSYCQMCAVRRMCPAQQSGEVTR